MILEAKGIHKYFVVQRGIFKQDMQKVCALDDVSFALEEFQTLGIVGESGSGKTTLAKIILNLIPASSGRIVFDPQKITNFRKDVQIIFQNPYNSLNPKMRIKDTLSEPLLIHNIVSRKQIKTKLIDLLRAVGLDETILNRRPSEFSGGQRQRICIARALATEPKIVVLDEPISSLDLTVQVQMLDLFKELKEKFHLTYIFISHNLAVIKYIADTVIVMQNGRIVEQASPADIFRHPANAYTKQLIQAARA